MADGSADGSLASLACLPMETQSEDSLYEDVSIELPDSEETQIIDNEEDQREVSLFLEIKSGKVQGPESTPFILPKRWTLKTLQNCVEDYINRKSEGREPRRVKQLYYKRARGKNIVRLDSESDVSSLIDEYPLRHPTGKKKNGRCIMYLAAELEDINDTPAHTVTPRRSPRLVQKKYDIFVHQIEEGTGKISNTCEVIHNVERSAKLSTITESLVKIGNDDVVYVPRKAIYWLRKGNKQPVLLKTEEDLDTCKKEYGTGSIRIACTVVNVSNSSPVDSSNANKRRRKLDMQRGEAQEQNELWNEIHVNLVRDLESKGLLWRYGVKHLKLWTDMIMDGKCSGVGEEPQWEEHLEQVIIPPKSRKRSASSSTSTSSSTTSPEGGKSDRSIIELMMLQHQQSMEAESRRAEMFQKTLLTMMSPNVALLQNQPYTGKQHNFIATPPGFSSPPSETLKGKNLKNLNLEECCEFLRLLPA
ncbi:hypothetical protein ACROYT_G033550 [Oculina patagonica]